jgi:hypothetical protein
MEALDKNPERSFGKIYLMKEYKCNCMSNSDKHDLLFKVYDDPQLCHQPDFLYSTGRKTRHGEASR